MEHNKELTKLAQNLRKNMTLEERTLWYHYLKFLPYNFHKQYVIGNYIVDFYCHEAKLVIELDGSQHYEPAGLFYDEKRTEFLNKLGLTVLRFSNSDITGNLKVVCDAIDNILMKCSTLKS